MSSNYTAGMERGTPGLCDLLVRCVPGGTLTRANSLRVTQAHRKAERRMLSRTRYLLMCLPIVTSALLVSPAAAHTPRSNPVFEALGANGGVTFGDPSFEASGGYVDVDISWSPCDVLWDEPVGVYVRGLDEQGAARTGWRKGYDPSGGFNYGSTVCSYPQPVHKSYAIGFSSPKYELEYRGINSGTVFIRTRDVQECVQTTSTERVSLKADGSESPEGGSSPYQDRALSDDGRFVLFRRFGSSSRFLIRDRAQQTIEQIDVFDLNGLSAWPGGETLSGDGQVVAFFTRAELVPSDTNWTNDIYVFDRRTNAFDMVSVGLLGAPPNGEPESHDL